LKCGVDVPEGQVFCEHCLSVMEEYPVKPGAHIHLPKRALAEEEQRKPTKKKRAPSPKEQISALRMKVMRLRLTAAILAFLLCVASAFLGLKLYQDFITPETGRNYTIDTSMND
jgi:hypothetical protein